MESIVGQTVSHYAFLEKLGAGGMGEIYKARDSRLNRIVAVKVLAAGRTRDPERRRRFIQEAQSASALNHPNIITIHDILAEGETQYMVMEHVSGQTLHALIAAGRMPPAQVLQIATQMANALAVAHAAGIIHRDLKPANVMVTSSGLVKILDFGLAKLMDPTTRMRAPGSDSSQTQDPVTLTAAPLTVEGAIMGTVNYMSPEQAEGLRVDARSDIFSFGAVLYEMVTGRRAFEGDSGISTLSAVLRDEVKPIAQIAPESPGELDQLIERCLRKNPDERWQSMAEVAAALNSLRARMDSGILLRPTVAVVPIELKKIEAKKPETKKPEPNKTILLAVTCAAVLILAGAGMWWQRHHPTASMPQTAPQPAAVATPPPAAQAAPAAAPDTPPPEPKTEPKDDAADAISSTAAPPPPTPVVPLASKSKSPAPPPVIKKAPVQLHVAAPPPAPIAPVAHAPAAPELVPVALGDGVPFRVALMDDVPNDVEVGHTVRFRALDGLQSGEYVVIPKGAIVTGTVAALAGKRNFFGERSKMRFKLISAESTGDAKVTVRATPGTKSDGDETRPFETPAGAARGSKDKNLIAASGTEYVAYIAGGQTVNVRK